MYAEIIRVLQSFAPVLTEHIADAALSDHGEDLSDAAIHDRDMDWLRSASYVVAEVTTPSLGVGYEVGRAVEMKIPVLALFRSQEGKRISAMVAGCGDIQTREYKDVSDLPRIFDEFFLA
jgi:hypothetical protein